VTPIAVANVKAFVNKNRRVTLEDIANKFSIGKASAHKILHEHLGMSKVSARWVPRQLSTDQKAIRVTNAKEHLSRFNREGDKFLNRFITGDEMWVHYSEPETIIPNLRQTISQSSGNELVPHLLKSLSCLLRLAKSCLLPFGIHKE
jgi:hypothetical protein